MMRHSLYRWDVQNVIKLLTSSGLYLDMCPSPLNSANTSLRVLLESERITNTQPKHISRNNSTESFTRSFKDGLIYRNLWNQSANEMISRYSMVDGRSTSWYLLIPYVIPVEVYRLWFESTHRTVTDLMPSFICLFTYFMCQYTLPWTHIKAP